MWRLFGRGKQDPRGGRPLRVAFNRRLVRWAWGGGNQWLRQMVGRAESLSFEARFDLKKPADWIVLLDPRPSKNQTFSVEEIESYKARHPQTRCLHRINENDLRKATATMDAQLEAANRVADHTVFVSGWLRDYHAQRWFDSSKPNSVIANAADERLFNASGAVVWSPAEPLRFVTHHWSDNWMKGFDVYQRIDSLIAEGRLPGAELWVIGRWPKELAWKAARTFSPKPAPELARLLKRCHVYVTASRWEPAGVLESMASGVPVVSTRTGMPADMIRNGINGMLAEIADAAGLAAQAERLVEDWTLRQAVAAEACETIRAYDWRQLAPRYADALYRPLQQ